MSLSIIQYVVNHANQYSKKSKSTNELNNEPAIVPRSISNHHHNNSNSEDTSDCAGTNSCICGSDSSQVSLPKQMKYKNYVGTSSINGVFSIKEEDEDDELREKKEIEELNKLKSIHEDEKAHKSNEDHVKINAHAKQSEDEHNKVNEHSTLDNATLTEPTLNKPSFYDSFIRSFNATLQSNPPTNSNHQSQIFKITSPHQLVSLLEYNYNEQLNSLPSSDEMFPYLHGLNNIRQRAFFNDSFAYNKPLDEYTNNHKIDDDIKIPQPNFFSLLTIDVACSTNRSINVDSNEVSLINSIEINDLLTPRDDHESKEETPSSEAVSNDNVVDDGLSEKFIECIEYESFDHINKLKYNQSELKNRDFELQIKLMAPLSNFLIYNSDELNQQFHDLNNLENHANLISSLTNKYQHIPQFIYIIDFELINIEDIPTKYIECSIDAINQPINSINNQLFNCKLLKYEQNLIWKTYSMKKIYPKVTIGNLIDFNNLTNSSEGERKIKKKHPFKLFINCHENAKFPLVEMLEELFKNLSNDSNYLINQESIYIEFPSAGSIDCSYITFEETLSFLNVLKLIDYYVHVLNEEVFIFSFDGFTGLSLLSLALGNLWECELTEDVIVNVLTKSNPSLIKLYFFKKDILFLKKFEKFINWFKLNHINHNDKEIEFVDDLKYVEINKLYNELIDVHYDEDSKRLLPNGDTCDWFDFDCDNNFPTNILSNLYLGSLAHASSNTIINCCKINKIISIGEKPSWFEDLDCFFDYEVGIPNNGKIIKSIYTFNNGNGKIYMIKLGDDIPRLSHLPNLNTIIYIHNVKDDGKDSLLPLLIDCPPHISQLLMIQPPELTTQKDITLIHCRIGVSRSASLVMASIMKYYNLNILQAYMFVRIRRFNIIIQPNLRIFYELFLFDEYLRKLNGKERRYCWSSLCNEIHKLNDYYIG